MMKHRLGRMTAAQLATRGVSSLSRAEDQDRECAGLSHVAGAFKVAPQVRGLFRTRIAG